MQKSKNSIYLSIVVLAAVSVLLAVLLILGPAIFELYMVSYRGFAPKGEALQLLKNVFGICFYSSAVFAVIILYALFRLLFNIKKGDVFIVGNVKCLKAVSWCCFAIATITVSGGIFYMPLIFVAMAGVFTGILLRVLKNVMQSAVELREDNELTI